MKGEGPPTHQRTIPQHFRGSRGSQLPTSASRRGSARRYYHCSLGFAFSCRFLAQKNCTAGVPGSSSRGPASSGARARSRAVQQRGAGLRALACVFAVTAKCVCERACQRTDGKRRAPDVSATPAAAPAAAAARSQELPWPGRALPGARLRDEASPRSPCCGPSVLSPAASHLGLSSPRRPAWHQTLQRPRLHRYVNVLHIFYVDTRLWSDTALCI